MRAVDVARAGGISVQQLRNYVDLGIVPATARTSAGYRVYTAAHARALAVARLVQAGHGWPRTRVILPAVHRGDLETALAALDASHAELDRERDRIAAVLGAFRSLTDAPAAPVRRGARIGEVADAVGVRTSSLRLWERRGLLRPVRERGTGYRVYDESELRRARIVALLRRGAYPFPIIAAVLDELHAGSPERVRAELAKREQDLHRRSRLRLRASAALSAYLDDLVQVTPSPR